MFDDNNPQRIEQGRRQFIKITGGAVGAGFIAGCTGEDSNGDGGNGSNNNNTEEDEFTPSNDDGDDGEEGEDSGGEFPDRSVTMIVVYGPGGGHDTYSRQTAPYLADELEVGVRVQNVTGAGGLVGHREIYDADPNGYTIGMTNTPPFAREQIIAEEIEGEDFPVDMENYTWLARTSTSRRCFAVAEHTGIETWDGFVEAVSNKELRWYNAGGGTTDVPVITGELSGLWDAEDFFDRQVRFEGLGQGVQAMLSEDLDAYGGTYSSLLPHLEGGGIKVINVAIMDEEPPEFTPEATTFGAEGVPKAQNIINLIEGARCYAGPPGLREEYPERHNTLARAFENAINNEQFQENMESLGRPVFYMDEEETREYTENLMSTWRNNIDLLETLAQE